VPNDLQKIAALSPEAEKTTAHGVAFADRLHVHQARCLHADDTEIPELKYTPDGPPGHPQAHLHWLFSDCMVDPDSGRYLSEDYAFCRRWRDIGGKIWVDRNCKLLHLGQHNFGGDLAESLRLQNRW
jgi:hypothetical protein